METLLPSYSDGIFLLGVLFKVVVAIVVTFAIKDVFYHRERYEKPFYKNIKWINILSFSLSVFVLMAMYGYFLFMLDYIVTNKLGGY